MIRSRSRLCFVLGLLLAATCDAQTVASTLTGRISDPSDAAVPAAEVRVINEGSGVAITVKTNTVGLYRVPSLSPGVYRVEVEASGFQRLVRRGIVLQVSQVLEVDLVLQLGNVTETVDVTASAPVVESQTSNVGQLVERSMIEGMPLPNRAATAMVILSPAAVVINQGGGGENIPIFSVGGGRARNQNYTLDGGNVTNVVGLAVPQQQTSLPMEAMQEFRIISNNYAAEHGHSTSGIITLSTRSGTNDFHGSLFEYARNDAFDARNFFSATKPRLRLHQFGGSLGGPIVKDKTHFFASWEQTRQTTGGTSIQTVPSEPQRLGDFSKTVTAAGQLITIYDPAKTAGNQRQPFPGNVIPAERIDPVAKAIVPFWPSPNRAGNVAGALNFAANSRPTFTRNIVVGRLDHQFRPSDQLMVRYYINDNSSENPGVFGQPEVDPGASQVEGRTQSILGAHTHIFSSSLINEFRLGHVRRRNVNKSFGLEHGYASQIGLKGVSDVGFPRLTLTGFAALGRATKFRLQTPIDDTQVQDAVSLYRGRHAFKMGVEYRRGFNQDNTDTSSSGNFAFTPLITALPGISNTGNAFASFLLGEVNNASIVRPDIIASRAAYWAGYLQDDWRTTERLTLNLGLRWEAGLPRRVDKNRMNSFDTAAINPVSGTPGIVTFAGRNGVPENAWDTDMNNFGPRFGFAYRLPGQRTTVIRGGAGIFYGSTASTIVATAAALGFSTDLSVVSSQPGITSALLLRDGFPSIPRAPAEDLGPGFGAVPVGERTTTSPQFFERSRPTPISLQYNFNIQHELMPNFLLETGYLANLSHHLTANDVTINQVPPDQMGPGNAQVRRPFPQFSGVAVVNPPLGNSTYHAFFVKAEKRYSAGLTFLAHYTFSKFIDDVASFTEFGDPGSYMDAYNRKLDKSLSGNDIRHRAVISGVYELPFFRDRGAVSYALGGWKTGVIATFQSGPPFTVVNNANTTNAFSAGSLRPDLAGDPKLPDAERSIERWFNTDAFRAPAQFRFGDSPRSVLRGPGIIGIDLSLLKSFQIAEAWKAEFRGEFFNFPNHTNFGLPGHSRGTPNFGVISGARSARTIQLGLRISF